MLMFGCWYSVFLFLIKRYMKVEAGCNRNFTVFFKQPSACRLTFIQTQHFLGFIGARRCLGPRAPHGSEPLVRDLRRGHGRQPLRHRRGHRHVRPVLAGGRPGARPGHAHRRIRPVTAVQGDTLIAEDMCR